MKSMFVFVLLFIFNGACAQQKAMEQFSKTATGCKDMACINKTVTQIDINLVALLGLRLAYMQRAHELKGGRHDSMEDSKKRIQAFDTIGNVAERAGYPSTYIRNIFYQVFQQTNLYIHRQATGVGHYAPDLPLPNRKSQRYHFDNTVVDPPAN